MTSLTDDLFSQLSGPALQQIAGQLGAGQAQTAGAVAAALPMILGAMGRNTAQPQGADALLGALGRDHAGAGGLGDILGAVLGGQQDRQTEGEKVLRTERYYGEVSRSFQLPSDIDEANAKARYDNGVLCLTLPKKISSAPQRLTVE